MRSRRSYERQIDKLFDIIAAQNDRIMHLAGLTWERPPVESVITENGVPVDQDRFVTSPEQYPDDF